VLHLGELERGDAVVEVRQDAPPVRRDAAPDGDERDLHGAVEARDQRVEEVALEADDDEPRDAVERGDDRIGIDRAQAVASEEAPGDAREDRIVAPQAVGGAL
jgi:hypothetical protein